MSPGARARAHALSLELEKEIKPLQNLRIHRGISQEEMARRMGKSQARISKMENSTNIGLETLFQSVEALGGRVKIIAEFPGENHEMAFADLHKKKNQERRDSKSAKNFVSS
ncbi:MAG: helix-turn-helix domain-containing protein [Thermovirgaceae bacterium]|nr:helix-turn-helix domain-containing protein [Thermovirgaceae bacterium]